MAVEVAVDVNANHKVRACCNIRVTCWLCITFVCSRSHELQVGQVESHQPTAVYHEHGRAICRHCQSTGRGGLIVVSADRSGRRIVGLNLRLKPQLLSSWLLSLVNVVCSTWLTRSSCSHHPLRSGGDLGLASVALAAAVPAEAVIRQEGCSAGWAALCGLFTPIGAHHHRPLVIVAMIAVVIRPCLAHMSLVRRDVDGPDLILLVGWHVTIKPVHMLMTTNVVLSFLQVLSVRVPPRRNSARRWSSEIQPPRTAQHRDLEWTATLD
mmetsp:Transcript_39514/g.88405  ORF Transcript_39514/g.88405 Transcript_39514/m.88405 type:complete len:267 (+) Transcript_39514:775-1575(+)